MQPELDLSLLSSCISFQVLGSETVDHAGLTFKLLFKAVLTH